MSKRALDTEECKRLAEELFAFLLTKLPTNPSRDDMAQVMGAVEIMKKSIGSVLEKDGYSVQMIDAGPDQ
jgi:hypothetical protein